MRQRSEKVLTPEKKRFLKLRAELFNTLVLSNAAPTYRGFHRPPEDDG